MIEYSLLFVTLLYSHPVPKYSALYIFFFFDKYVDAIQRLLKLSSICKCIYYAFKKYIPIYIYSSVLGVVTNFVSVCQQMGLISDSCGINHLF